jgi:heme-degrading monooxygenase HmoA
LESIQQWRQNTDHQGAKEKGKKGFYKKYTIRIAKVERDYAFEKKL